MLQYVNTFNCLYDSNEGNVVIRFSQIEPHGNDDGSISTEQYEIASIVLSKSGADALINTLNEVLSSKQHC